MESTTITTARSPRSDRRRAAFTLVEILVVMGLTTMVLTALFSSWGFVARSTLDITHYTEMNTIGRLGLETFARDIRRARKIEENFSINGMVLEMEEADGTRVNVSYTYDAGKQTLVRRDEDSGERQAVFKNVDFLKFSYFQTTGQPATNSLDTRLVQLELRMARPVQNRDTTKKIVSARYIMRNKQHGP